jgi:hypothetical protein
MTERDCHTASRLAMTASTFYTMVDPEYFSLQNFRMTKHYVCLNILGVPQSGTRLPRRSAARNDEYKDKPGKQPCRYPFLFPPGFLLNDV